MTALNSSRPVARRLLVAAALAGGALVTDVSAAAAQAYSYPAFQPPTIVAREYTGLVADAGRGAGTSLVFQWREGLTNDSQVSIDAGLADPDGGDARILLGAGYGLQVNRVAANADFPLDVMLTAGVYGNFGDGTVIRIPVGASLGRRFLLEGNFAVTPFFHPRASVNFCTDCGGGEGDVDLGLNFDIGADFELTPVLSIRGAVMFGGDEPDAFGLGLSWRPRGLR